MISSPWIVVIEAEGYGRTVLNGQGDNNLPDGWNEKRVSIKRSRTYFGLNRMITTSLKFVTNGKDLIQRIYENEGTEFEVNIAWYEYNELPIDKYFLFFAGLVDLSTYDIEETFIKCDVNESNIARKFVSRQDIKVNLNALESIEGVTLPTNSEVTVTLQQRELVSVGTFALNEAVSTAESQAGIDEGIPWEGFTLPIVLQGTDVDNLSSQDVAALYAVGGAYWDPAGEESIVTLSGTVTGTLTKFFDSANSLDVSFRIRVYTDDTLTAIEFDSPLTGASYTIEDGSTPLPFTFSIDVTFGGPPPAVNIGEDMVMSLIAINTDVTGTIEDVFLCEFTEIDFKVSVVSQWNDTTQAQGYLMHEVGQRISEVILDKEGVFKSDFLGRTDIGYPVDGAGSQQTVHSGKQIRAIPNECPSLNFKDWFTSMNAMHSMGAGIEHDEFNNPFLRVEEKAHFFSGQVVVTIHSVSNMKKTVAREWIYNEVEVGYESLNDEQVNGALEYNNKFEWACSAIKNIKNKLDLVSKLNAGGYPIEFARRLQYSDNPTEDSKYDNKNFTVIVKEDGTLANGDTKYKNEQDEDYDIVENIFSPETAYNLKITPGNMFRNNGGPIRSGLEHYLDEPIKFQFAEQLENLKSQVIGEASITENDDIDVSTLSAGLWIPEIYSFENVLTREQLAAITKNQNGIIKFSTTTLENTTKYYYGWILDMPTEPESDTSEMQLLRVNTSNPDVKLVDPEGSTPTQPPIIVDPTNIFGVFEGPFEFIFSG